MQIYTLDEFNVFISHVPDNINCTIFTLLFYTGIRKGKLFALTIGDIDFENGIIDINKFCQKVSCENVITSPKTARSVRKIQIVNMLREYVNCLYDNSNEIYLFMNYYRRTK